MNLILLGLNTIATLIGYNNFSSYEFCQDDLNDIAMQTNILQASLENASQMFDVYTLEGQNRYVCFDFDTSYLIYDKADDVVKEYILSTSPYKNYENYLCVYVENSEYIKHGYVDDFSVFSLDDNAYLDDILINNSLDGDSEAGQYLIFDEYGADVTKITNAFYFEHLNDKHGTSPNGTCGIVAIQILLGYYDTFYNDNIIPENYDYTSAENKSSYIDFEQSPGSGQSFHDYLISFASANNITSTGVNMNINQERSLVTSFLQSRDIEFGFKSVEGNWADTTSNAASAHIRTAIDNNNPIFFGAAGHASVAFAYDSNYIYVHSGWGDIRRTPWSTVTTDFWDFWGGPHTIEIQNILTEHYHSDNYYSYSLSKILCPCGMVYSRTNISPSDYGFEEQYFFYETTKNVSVGNLTFETKRLRTGYIEEETINLSPRRIGAGLAYLEYNFFASYVRKVIVDLSMWSSTEYMDSSDSTILLQYLDSNSNNWETYYDLLNDCDLSENRYEQDKYIINFPNGTQKFRFYSTSSTIGDRNKGRLSIGEMIVEYIFI